LFFALKKLLKLLGGIHVIKPINMDNNFHFSLQTIKCLLIVPNPESALNEEAGKLLLEEYDDYSRRAKMMTDIHAKSSQPDSAALDVSDSSLCGKKRGLSDKTIDKKKKDKKRALKRL
jgi:ubiquitin-conjugating enzyme E2 S